MKVGVLALQGVFREHAAAFRMCGCDCIEVCSPAAIDALALPGGESTTSASCSANTAGAAPGRDAYGTCRRGDPLAREIADSDQPRLGLMDMSVRRNAYGRQVDSFETSLAVPCLGEEPFPAVFIRAPLIEPVGPEVEVLSRLKEGIVMVSYHL